MQQLWRWRLEGCNRPAVGRRMLFRAAEPPDTQTRSRIPMLQVLKFAADEAAGEAAMQRRLSGFPDPVEASSTGMQRAYFGRFCCSELPCRLPPSYLITSSFPVTHHVNHSYTRGTCSWRPSTPHAPVKPSTSMHPIPHSIPGTGRVGRYQRQGRHYLISLCTIHGFSSLFDTT